MDKKQLYETILKKIEKPIIKEKEYIITDFGVSAGSDEVQTAKIQAALDNISENGGGKIIFPPGVYKTGALHLKTGVELNLQAEDTVLSFVNEDIKNNYPIVYSHWEATPCYNFSSLIYAIDSHDIAVTGKGIIDGGADSNHWWNWHHQVENAWSSNNADLQLEDRKKLRKMNIEGIPVEQRVFGNGHFLRPNSIQLIRCRRILLQGVTILNSPMWQLNPVMCESVTIDGMTLSSHGSNNDGCNPESCSGVHIKNCHFDTGDDCVSLKSGRDRDGIEANKPCEYVLIEDNDFMDGHGGIALGSEMSGGVRYVLAWKNRFTSPNLTYALRFKTNARRGGIVEKIALSDSVINNIHGAAVHGTMLYEDGRNGSNLPVFRDILIENIEAKGGDYGVFFEAFDETPITGLELRNIKINGVTTPMRSMNWVNPIIENVVINGMNFPRPCNVRILGVTLFGNRVNASADFCGDKVKCEFYWEASKNGTEWEHLGTGNSMVVPERYSMLRVKATDEFGNEEISHVYKILDRTYGSFISDRLVSRFILDENEHENYDALISRGKLAVMLMPLLKNEVYNFCNKKKTTSEYTDECLEKTINEGYLALDKINGKYSEGYITREELGTVAMQACGINYRNYK